MRMKLAVDVIEARDLMPKDGQGSASPFVEVTYNDQNQRTHTKPKDLNPTWNQTLIFNVPDPTRLPDQTITISVYNDPTNSISTASGRNFLGRVLISGSSIAPSLAQATIQRFPLDKRGLFSHIRGDIALRLYTIPENMVCTKNQEEAAREFYSAGKVVKEKHARAEVAPPRDVVVEGARSNNGQEVEYGLVETSPQVGGRVRYRGGDKVASTYDLVEQMYYLYVNVVKARDLPGKDLSGSLDPYVEVKVGNYKGITKHLEKNHNPVWHQVFAFSRDHIQANLLEVTVKDRDVLIDDFVGHVIIDLSDVPTRVPPDSPLAPQWYHLETRNGDKLNKGEIMFAVWMGSQADEAFPNAWLSDAHSIAIDSLTQTQSKVYFSPKLCYLRVHVIQAQDFVPADPTRQPDASVRIQLGNQLRRTRPARSTNPTWNEEFVFVASDPFDDDLILTAEDGGILLGRVVIPVLAAQQRADHTKPVESRWFNLSKHTDDNTKETSKFSSKIHVRLCLDTGYHVLDESAHYISDLRPSAKHLRNPSVGIMDIGILGARNLMAMKGRDGRTTDGYCVAKYGPKWVRTRTLLNTVSPRWNEQYTFDVYDPCTVLTVAVFDNAHVEGGNARDQRIGKIRIRLSTLEVDRVYTHFYPLLVLQPTGLKKTGELHLAIRFSCSNWANLLALYGKPILPKMHYLQPISLFQMDYLRHQAVQIVAARLGRSEPPLRREVVEYMLDTDTHMFSLRKSKANFYRIVTTFSGVAGVVKWFDDVRMWKNPVTTMLVHVLFLVLTCFPELILPTIFLYLFMIGVWNYSYRVTLPGHMDTKLSHAEWAHGDELDEEFDTFPTSRAPEVVRMRYDRLRSVAGKVQTVMGDVATQGERAGALLSWRDPRATGIFMVFAVVCAVVLYVTPFWAVALLLGLYLMRHPKLRTPMPSMPFNFYRRLPSKADILL